MNQQTPLRTPQRPAPRRADEPIPKKKDMMPKLLAILLASAVLLIITTVVLVFVALPSLDEAEKGEETTQTNGDTPSAAANTKTGITLPSVTGSGAYSYSLSDAVDMSSDSMIQSSAAALIDVTNGRGVATKNGTQRVYPASMTKVMTLLIACENAKNPTALLTVTEEMVERYQRADGASLATDKWKAGVQVTVEDALYMVIYSSDTYACWLLADYVAGSEAAFVGMMNQRVGDLGLSETTHFENSTGLYHDNHYTTCLDMATIMAVAMNNPVAKKILTANSLYTVDFYENGEKSANVSLYSGWYTARLEKYPYGKAAPYYAGNGSDVRLVAGKTGYEDKAGYCFVTAGINEKTGTLYVCVQTNGASVKESTDDSREIYQAYAKN